jgi:N-methylhydantoinase A
MATRVGVDVGGTFTDLIFYDDRTATVSLAKAPTTPAAPEQGVMEAVGEVVARPELEVAQFFMHGATIGLNALLQRAGAVTALLCTEGFRDSLEIRRADRDAMYDIRWRQPEALVPRSLRLPVRERIRADGEILQELDEPGVEEAAKVLAAAGVEAVAICFINAYVNPSHELATERLLRASGFVGDISLSHRLTREYREYERTSTTVVDAYIRGVTSGYLQRLSGELSDRGFGGEVLVMRSGGGVLGTDEIAERPFEAIQSGPVAGVTGAAELCRAYDWPLGITADVGGTSFDTALVSEGRPRVRHEGEIAGWPLLTPWVDVRSIGAGGGSIAYSDAGRLRVGPRSAGAVPGPACYGRGGELPTVTDSALLLGMLGDGRLAGGLELDPELARSALAALAPEFGMATEELARGVITIVTAAMAEIIREITIGQGEDPRQARLIAFGGAGPLFAGLIASELEIRDIVIPEFAGNFSAWGLLGQDRTYDAARTAVRPWGEGALGEIGADAKAMLADIGERRADARHEGAVENAVTFHLRYTGQDHTIPITLGLDGDLQPAVIADVEARFAEEYERRFGVTLDVALELVTLRLTVRELLPRASGALRHSNGDGTSRARTEGASHRGYSFRRGDWMEFQIIGRGDLVAGQSASGPLVITEDTATTYVDDGFVASVDDRGALLLTNQTIGESGWTT